MAEMEEAFTSVSDGIGELVLNRPERKNALSPTLVAALSAGAQCSAACSGCALPLTGRAVHGRAGRADRRREGHCDPHPRQWPGADGRQPHGALALLGR